MNQVSLFESFNIFSALFFLASTSSLIFGTIVLVKNSSEKLNRLMFFLCLIIGIESFGYALTFWTTNIADVYLFMGIACIGYCLLWPVAIHFLVVFSFGKVSKAWIVNIIILYIVAIFYIVTWFTGLTASAGFERIKYGWLDHPNQTIFYYIYLVYAVYGYICLFTVCLKTEITYRKNKRVNLYKKNLFADQFSKISQVHLCICLLVLCHKISYICT